MLIKTLYHINPNNYGQEYMVMADTKKEALHYVTQLIKKECDEHMEKFKDDLHEDHDFHHDYNKFNEATPENMPDEYTIDEYNYGEVLSSEIA